MTQDETNAEIERLRNWISDLQSGLYVNCVYCGHRYGPGETTPVSMADALKAHVEQCPKHPMSALKEENARLRAALGYSRTPTSSEPASLPCDHCGRPVVEHVGIEMRCPVIPSYRSRYN